MVSQAEWDDMMDEVRKGAAPRQAAQPVKLWPARGRDRIALLAVIAGVVLAAAGILAPQEHASYLQALGNTLAWCVGGCIFFTAGAYGTWRRKAVARNTARQRGAR